MNEYVIAKYIRLSLDDAISESMSIPNQRVLLDRHIESLGIANGEVLEFVEACDILEPKSKNPVISRDSAILVQIL